MKTNPIRLSLFPCTIFALMGSSGCWPGPTLLKEMPTALDLVINDQETFSDADHPLKGVIPGTVIGNPDQLDGCWGRVEPETNPDSGNSWLEGEILIVALSDSSVRRELIQGLNGTNLDFFDVPYVRVFYEHIDSVEPDSILRTIERVEFGELQDDGTFRNSFHAQLGAEIDTGPTYSRPYTVDGDFLIIAEPNSGIATSDSDKVDYYYRFACPE